MTGNAASASELAEEELLEFTQRVARHRAGRTALHVRLSKLENMDQHANRQAASFFHNLIKDEKGKLFRLSSGDAVFIGNGASQADISNLSRRLAIFFSKDPAFAKHPDDLNTQFDLATDYDAFLSLCESLKDDAVAALEAPEPEAEPKAASPFAAPEPAASGNVRSLLEHSLDTAHAAPPPTETKPPHRLFFDDEEVRPMAPADLDRLESNFRVLDPTNLLIDLPVAAIVGDMPPHVIFSEKAIDYDSLQAVVLPSRDMRADPNLFERLCRIIEKQLLKKLVFELDPDALANSFPCHVDAVLSNTFLQFDMRHRQRSDAPLLVDIRLQDALNHIARYMRARDRIHGRGYRVCISGLNSYGFATLDHSHKLADFIKVDAPRHDTELDETWRGYFLESAKVAGVNRLILSHCDTEYDFEAGRELGFSLFQGKYVNQCIAASAGGSTAVSA